MQVEEIPECPVVQSIGNLRQVYLQCVVPIVTGCIFELTWSKFMTCVTSVCWSLTHSNLEWSGGDHTAHDMKQTIVQWWMKYFHPFSGTNKPAAWQVMISRLQARVLLCAFTAFLSCSPMHVFSQRVAARTRTCYPLYTNVKDDASRFLIFLWWTAK